jgi:hypothetical protein
VGRALKLDSFFFSAVAAEPALSREAVAVAVISALVMGLGLTLVGTIKPIWWLVGGIAWATGVLALGSWFFVVLGRRFGGRGRFDAMVRGLGYAVAPQALGFIPIGGFVPGFVVGGLWATAGVVVAVREVHEIPTGVAVRLVIAAILVIVAFVPLVVVATQSGA